MTMMKHRVNCNCPHHTVGFALCTLTGLALLGFWIATLSHGSLFGISETHYFKEVIVLGIATLATAGRVCTCCCGGCGMCVDKSMMSDMNKTM